MKAIFLVAGLGRRLGQVMQITIAAARACAFVGSISQTYSSLFLRHMRKLCLCDMLPLPNAATQARSPRREDRAIVPHHGGNPPNCYFIAGFSGDDAA